MRALCPMWAYARLFKNGVSQPIMHGRETVEQRARLKLPPYYGVEPSLGYIMGTCGSAFSVDLFNVIKELLGQVSQKSCEARGQVSESQQDKIVAAKSMTTSTLSDSAPAPLEIFINMPRHHGLHGAHNLS